MIYARIASPHLQKKVTMVLQTVEQYPIENTMFQSITILLELLKWSQTLHSMVQLVVVFKLQPNLVSIKVAFTLNI